VGGLSVWALLVPMFVIVSSLPFVLPNTTALALADHAAVAGTASALLGVIQFMIGAIAAPLVGVAGPDSAVPMGVVMVTLALGALVAHRVAGRRQPWRLAR
jgi:DHA1 family bicyclomycin/chloramphenicol resistance-like MFS transporter